MISRENLVVQPIPEHLISEKKSPLFSKVVNRIFGAWLHKTNEGPKVEDKSLQNIFSDTKYWHGTGRKQYRDGEVIDVLAEILKSKSLNPHPDEWDPSTGKVITTSLALSRMYARIYAECHFEESTHLTEPCGDTKLWATYFLGWLFIDTINEFMSPSEKLSPKVFVRFKEKFMSKENQSRWQGKFRRTFVATFDSFREGSDITGNYPILFGIKDELETFQPTSKGIARHEARTGEPITLDTLSHIEVPLENLPETEALLRNHGISIPIIAIEQAESFCRNYSFSTLVQGGPY